MYQSLEETTWYSIGNSKWFHLCLFLPHILTAIFQFNRGMEETNGNMCLYQVDWSMTDAENSTATLDHVVTANVYYVDASFELFTAMAHLAYFMFISLGTDVSFDVRMYEYAISASLMIFIVGSVCGIRDFHYLLFLMALIIITMFLGRNHEVNWTKNNYADLPVWKTPTVLGWFPYMWAWIFIFVQFYRSIDNSQGKPPDGVYAIVWVLFLFYSAFGFNQLYNLRGEYLEVKKLKYNATSNILSITSKLILSWIVFSGIAATGDKSCVV